MFVYMRGRVGKAHRLGWGGLRERLLSREETEERERGVRGAIRKRCRKWEQRRDLDRSHS